MGAESEYCRGPMARMFNHMPGFKWVPSYNVNFKNPEVKGRFVSSGEPDGHAHAPFGVVLYVECKAYFGGIDFSHVSPEQEQWFREKCVESGTDTLHYIGIAVYPERKRPARCDLDLWKLYLIPTWLWLTVRDLAKAEPYHTNTIPLTPELGSRKWKHELYGDKYFGKCALQSCRIPVEKVEKGKAVVRNELVYKLQLEHPAWAHLRDLHVRALAAGELQS